MLKKPITDRSMAFQLAFLAPKYWVTWLLMAFVGVSAALPRVVSVKIGDTLGRLYQRANKKRANIVKTNLALCFPSLSEADRDAMARQHFQFYGRSVIDFGLTWWASKKRLARLIHFKNEALYLETIAKHNVILLLPHMTGLDCGAGYSAILHPSITMMKAQDNGLLNWRLWKGRTRIEPTRVIMRAQGLRPLIRAAKNHVACYYMPDEDFGDLGSTGLTVFAPFFGIQTSTLTTLSKMAKMAKAKVVPIYPIMRDDGHYEVSFDAPLENFPSGDEAQDAIRVNQVVEKAVLLAPAQYMWTLQWFKTRPKGEPSPYTNKDQTE